MTRKNFKYRNINQKAKSVSLPWTSINRFSVLWFVSFLIYFRKMIMPFARIILLLPGLPPPLSPLPPLPPLPPLLLLFFFFEFTHSRWYVPIVLFVAYLLCTIFPQKGCSYRFHTVVLKSPLVVGESRGEGEKGHFVIYSQVISVFN